MRGVFGVAATLLADVAIDVWRVIVACSLLMLAVAGFGAGVWLIRRKFLSPPERTGGSGEPFTLEGLRQMREEGAVSEAEYQAMRAAMIDALTRDEGIPKPDRQAVGFPIEFEPETTEKDGDWDWVDPDFDLKKGPET